jgi:hypothetical protein
MFEAMLRCKFKSLPGENRVIRGQYLLLKGKQKKAIIDREMWEETVFPGSDVRMSMIIDNKIFSEGLCPRPGCGKRNTSSSGETGTTIW